MVEDFLRLHKVECLVPLLIMLIIIIKKQVGQKETKKCSFVRKNKQTTTRPGSYGLFWKRGYYSYEISTIKKRPALPQNKGKDTLGAPSR